PPRKESPRGEQGGEDENRQSPDWRFDSQCVQIVVPPAPHFLLAVQVRPLSLLKVVTLLVDTEEKIRRDRHWHRTQPCSTELISRDLVRVPASQRAADELKAIQLSARILEAVAEIQHIESDHQDSEELQDAEAADSGGTAFD